MRNVLLLGVLSGLVLFAAQNWSSSALAIVFLGMKTPVLPLAVWILIALIAGFLTSCLLQFSHSLLSPSPAPSRKPAASRPSRPRPEPAENPGWRETSYAYTAPNQEDVTATSAEDASDWDDNTDEVDEWDDWEEEAPAPRTKSYQPVEEPRDYEVRQEPKTVSRSGSVYSYSYREPSGSGVGKTEDVYDAEFTLITPPSPEYDPQTSQPRNQQEDDWGLEDGEDEFDDEEPDNRRPRPS